MHRIVPRTNHDAARAQAFFHFSVSAVRIRAKSSVIWLREKICRIDIAPRTARTIGAENLVRNKPDKLIAAINKFAGVIFWKLRQQLQTVAVKKNAAGTSESTNGVCARKFGSNAASVAAIKPPMTPKNSRAMR